MFEKEKQSVIEAGIKLDRYGLIALSGGNVTLRMPSGEILVTPSGMIYEDMEPEDVLVMDIEGNILEGERKPSVDSKALLYILKNMPEINAVIHTHQPSAASMQMGVETVENIGDKLAVILKHHGVISVGDSLKQALYACVYLEEAAKTYSIAYGMNPNVPLMTPEQIERAVEVFRHYGQGTTDLPEELQYN